MSLRILIIPETGMSANSYIVFSEESKEGFIVDPACPVKLIEDNLAEHKLKLNKIVLTHGHGDHIASVEELRDKYKLPVYIHRDDEAMIGDGDYNFSTQMFGSPIEFKADKLLEEGDLIEVDPGHTMEVIHTPGHTKGGICLLYDKYLITGDTLFQGSIGRTDFPGGNFNDIIASIKDKLFILDEDTIVLPGHGPKSTIGYEKMYNPFLK